MIISGGGINGISIIGAVNKFFEFNKREKIKEILGISVGSIIGLLIILGYNKDEMKNIFMEIQLNKFMDYKVKRFIDDWGFDDGNLNKKLLKAILINKKYNGNITLLELYKKSGIKFIIAVTNLTKGVAEYFTYINHPNMEIVNAIIISCSFPVIYTPVKLNNNIYIDGGVLANYPIEYFKNIDNVIGFVIDYFNKKGIESKINKFDEYYLTLLKIIINKYEFNKTHKYKKNTVIIDRNKLINNPMEYKLNNKTKEKLYITGENAFMDFYLSNNI